MQTLSSEIDLRQVRQGVTLADGGCYFAVWSPYAKNIYIHLFDKEEKEYSKVKLPERNGGTWYGFIPNVGVGDLYAIEATGEYDPSRGFFFKEGRLLVDPYAKALSHYYPSALTKCGDDNSKYIPKAIITDDNFDWEGVKKPSFGRRSMVIYELNVKGFTKLCDFIPEKYQGKFLGICEDEVIAHLKKLGITAIQLNPIAAYISEPHLAKLGLVNYWGYNPVSFMAPDPKYAVDKFNCVNEFKTMVKKLHQHGIAVLLDVVYNHTGEGGIDGPVLSMRGLDARNYYVYKKDEFGKKDYSRLHDVSGCGNSFNCDARVGLNLVTKALTYWADEMQVDGFRFDLGVAVSRESHGDSFHEFERNSAFLKACFINDTLSESVKIAEPWDCGPNGYRLGQFPIGWSEQNDRFRDCMRDFWRGERGLIGEFATRMMGSRDIFVNNRRSIGASVNFITYHDGFTLNDLVSYEKKHNEANGEGNRDGSYYNHSCNFGVEGETDDPTINERRWQMKRNLIASLFISQGIPHFLAGDEFSKTQNGNNNVYCQDNQTSWQKWNYSDENVDFIAFISKLAKIRHNSEMLKELNLIGDSFHYKESKYKAQWYQPNSEVMTDIQWNNPNTDAIVLTLSKYKFLEIDQINAEEENNSNLDMGEIWCFVINQTYGYKEFTLPKAPLNMEWIEVLDSSNPRGDVSTGGYGVKQLSVLNPCIRIFKLTKNSSTRIYESASLNSLSRHQNRIDQY